MGYYECKLIEEMIAQQARTNEFLFVIAKKADPETFKDTKKKGE